MKKNPHFEDNRERGTAGRRALDSAFRLLTRRDHTRRELEVKLRRKGFGTADIARAIARVDELGYLDDARTATMMAEHMVGKGYGILRIRHVLGQKGLNAESIEKALDCCGDDRTQVCCARRVLEKKQPRMARETDPVKRRQWICRFLAGRGFPAPVVRQVMDDACR